MTSYVFLFRRTARHVYLMQVKIRRCGRQTHALSNKNQLCRLHSARTRLISLPLIIHYLLHHHTLSLSWGRNSSLRQDGYFDCPNSVATIFTVVVRFTASLLLFIFIAFAAKCSNILRPTVAEKINKKIVSTVRLCAINYYHKCILSLHRKSLRKNFINE